MIHKDPNIRTQLKCRYRFCTTTLDHLTNNDDDDFLIIFHSKQCDNVIKMQWVTVTERE